MRFVLIPVLFLALSCSFPSVTYVESCEEDADCSNDRCRVPCERNRCSWDKVTCDPEEP